VRNLSRGMGGVPFPAFGHILFRPLFDDSRSPRKRSTPNQSMRRALRLEALEERALMTLQGNQLFPSDNPWNEKITAAPVAANSNTLVASIGAALSLHPDFGTVYNGALNGIPYNVVSGTQPKVTVVIDAYESESDLLPVPIPAGAVIEGDPLAPSQNSSDRHLIVYDQDQNIAYELFNVHRPSEEPDNQWHADSEAVWDMSKDSFRTPGFTSADAAGLPILPGLVRPDEVLDQGIINHALRFTVPKSDSAYVFPASHQAGVNNPAYPRMGERFRLKSSFDISGFPPADRVILQALKDYGMIVADNGSSWYLSGTPSSRWSDDDLHALTQVLGSNFEAVDLTPIVSSLDQAFGPSGGGTTVTIHGQNFSGAAGQLQVLFGTAQVPSAQVSVVSDTMLVGTSPAHNAGAVDVTVQTPYGTSAISSSDKFTFTSGATVAARYLFYDNSTRYDTTGNPQTSRPFSDDNAIATDKSAYLPGSGPATFANVSSYDQGINGIMVDLSGSGSHTSITQPSITNDFTFKVGNNNAPNTWAAAPNPSTVTVRAGAGVSGSDRVELIWPSGSIKEEWLEVTVKATADTGLAANDVFFFGSAVGNSGNGDTVTLSETTSVDELGARNNSKNLLNNIPDTNVFDYNRDGLVSSVDQLLARNNAQTLDATRYINIPISGPFSPLPPSVNSVADSGAAPAAGNSGAVASALASTLSSPSPSLPPTSAWIVDRLSHVDLDSGPVAKYLEHLTEEDTARSRAILVKADQVADALNLDDTLLDSLLVKLGLE
jgi:hypothetical protein